MTVDKEDEDNYDDNDGDIEVCKCQYALVAIVSIKRTNKLNNIILWLYYDDNDNDNDGDTGALVAIVSIKRTNKLVAPLVQTNTQLTSK